MSDAGRVVVANGGTLRSAISAGLVIMVGLAALARSGPGVGPMAVTVLGGLLLLSVLMDRPTRTEFTAEGIRRVCPLRASTLAWVDVVAIERARVSSRALGRGGGLVARTRRGRWLLSDAAEAVVVHEALAHLVAHAAPSVRFLVVAEDPDALAHDPAESFGARWLTWNEALAAADEPALRRLLEKAREACSP